LESVPCREKKERAGDVRAWVGIGML